MSETLTAGKPVELAGPKEKSGALTWVLLALIAAGVFCRFLFLSRRPLWDDEAFAFFVASDSLGHLWHSLSMERHPPLFFFLEWVAVRLFGPSEFALRLFPALFGTLLIPITFHIGRKLWGKEGGLLSAALVACSPLLLYHSQEARSSSLLVLGLVVGGWCLWEHMAKPTLITGVGGVLGTWTAMTAHYLGLAMVPFALMVFVFRAGPRRLPSLAPLAGIFAGLVPLGMLIMEQRKGVYGGAITFASDQDLPLPLSIFRSLMLLGNGAYPDGKLRIIGYALFTLGMALGLGICLKYRKIRRQMLFPLVLAAFMLLFLRGGALVLKWPVRDNYMPIVAPGVYLALGGLAFLGLKALPSRLALAAVFVAMLSGSALLVQGSGHPNPDFRGAGQLVAQYKPDGVLLARTWGDLACYGFYQKDSAPVAVYGLDPASSPTIESRVVNRPLQTTESLIEKSHRLCVVGKISGTASFGPLNDQLTAKGYHLAGEHKLQEAQVLLYERDGGPLPTRKADAAF